MLAAEARIPELAPQAGREAHNAALAEGHWVAKRSKRGMLVEMNTAGETRVLKALPERIQVSAGLVLKRRKV